MRQCPEGEPLLSGSWEEYVLCLSTGPPLHVDKSL